MMQQEFIRSEIGRGIYFSHIRDAKFKTNRISVNFLLPLTPNDAPLNALVPNILTRATAHIKNAAEMNRITNGLYGAYLDADVSKLGDTQVVSIILQTMDDRYALQGEPLMKKSVELLGDILFAPALIDGNFKEDLFALEKTSLIDGIKAQINEKRALALLRLRELLCQGDAYGIDKLGSLEQAHKATAALTTAAYREMLRSAQVEILCTGGGDVGAAGQWFAELFSHEARQELYQPETATIVPSGEAYREKTERFAVSQSKLALGFLTDPLKNEQEKNAMRLMSALLGATPTSRLFTYVREQLSLCYYCAARYDRIKEVMTVDCGIEAENRQKAFDEIMNQIRIMGEGGFTAKELEQTKLYLQNSFLSVYDSLSSLEGWYLSQIYTGGAEDPRESARKMQQLDADAVAAAARKLRLCASYFLTGTDNS